MRKTGLVLFGLVGATLLSQFPEYFQQYTQRLGGRLDELTLQVTALERRAAESGKDVPGYLRGFLQHGEVDVRREGLALQALVQRRAALAEAYQALTGAGRWWRVARFADQADWDIAAATLTAYRPAVPVTPEAAVYGGAGFGAGAAVFLAIVGLWRGGRRRARPSSLPNRR